LKAGGEITVEQLLTPGPRTITRSFPTTPGERLFAKTACQRKPTAEKFDISPGPAI
jgi:hypothetical protein